MRSALRFSTVLVARVSGDSSFRFCVRSGYLAVFRALRLEVQDFSLGQRFLPRLDCDVAEVWKLSKVEARRGRLTDAMEAHALSRLAGLRNKLWLIVGASLVHAIMRAREACP